MIIVLAALAVWAVAASSVGAARDGYSRVPTRAAGPADSAMRWH